MFQNYFDIEETTGIVFVKSKLDRETAEKVELKILVRDLNGLHPSPDQQTATGILIYLYIVDLFVSDLIF
jgi:hypothetical protein